MPPIEIRAFHHTLPNPFFPGVLLPGITFMLLYAWPFLEARFTGDRRYHNLLDRPRDRPLRTALGVSTITFYAVLFMAGGTDVLASTFSISLQDMVHLFQVLLLLAPPVLGFLTWRVLKDLQSSRSHPIQQPVGGRVVRTPAGGYHVLGVEDEDGDGGGGPEPAAVAVDQALEPG